MTDEISVPKSPAAGQAMAGLRDVLKIAGAALITNGVYQGSVVQFTLGAFLTAGPVVWSQIVVRLKHYKLIDAAFSPAEKVVLK